MKMLSENAVEFKGICKSFQQVCANENLTLSVKRGSVHAIIGENGAGKSTAMKILYGIYPPDQGEVYLNGKLWGGRMKPWATPFDAIVCGVGMVHQHFMLGGPYSVLDNIVLGVESATSFWRWLPACLRPIDKKAARKKLETLSQQYGLSVDLDARVENLSVGVQQRIEILKLLYRDAQILILDEPTAVLTPKETNELFDNLKKLAHQGKTILMITHKLKEVMSVADRVTVFRGGRVVGEREIQQTNVEDLATLMVGRKVNLNAESLEFLELGEPVLDLNQVTLGESGRLKNLSFQVRAGEVVGISGVEGNGQSDLIQLLLHPKSYQTDLQGSIHILGQDARNLTSREVKKLGVGIIPDDRHRDALILDRPVRENFLLGLHRRGPFCKFGLISRTYLEKATQKVLKEYDIRPASTGVSASALSGGNQQKLVIAREFEYEPRFLIAAQPTRGVDVGAIEFIHKKILEARSHGCGVLLISSELDEVLALSDRILVMYEGKIVAEFQRGEASEKSLGLKMGGES